MNELIATLRQTLKGELIKWKGIVTINIENKVSITEIMNIYHYFTNTMNGYIVASRAVDSACVSDFEHLINETAAELQDMIQMYADGKTK